MRDPYVHRFTYPQQRLVKLMPKNDQGEDDDQKDSYRFACCPGVTILPILITILAVLAKRNQPKSTSLIARGRGQQLPVHDLKICKDADKTRQGHEAG